MNFLCKYCYNKQFIYKSGKCSLHLFVSKYKGAEFFSNPYAQLVAWGVCLSRALGCLIIAVLEPENDQLDPEKD